MFEIYTENNEKLQCEVLFTFEKNNKSFIVYQDNDNEILASLYKIEGDKAKITPIIDEKDYDLVDDELEKWWNNNE